MGMAASQVRLLQLTSRKLDIGRELENLSMQKTAMTKETSAATKKYREAMNSKTYKWSNNSGVNYIDLSYSALMKPSVANQYTPYLLTNSSGKVIVDTQYYDYAKMLSPSGSAVNDWEKNNNRTAILSALTGIPAETIENADAAKEAKEAANGNVNKLQSDLDKHIADETEYGKEKNSVNNFIKKIGKTSAYDFSNYSNTGSNPVTINSETDLKKLTDSMATNMEKYLLDGQKELFTEACNEYYENAKEYIGKEDASATATKYGIKKNTLTVQDMVNWILGSYRTNLDKASNVDSNDAYYTKDNNTYNYYTRDTESTAWNNWNTTKTELEKQLEAAKKDADTKTDTYNQALSSDQERMIAYYDNIFKAIADNGWEYNSQISDNDYLNDMLQNNEYYIATMTKQEDDKGETYYEYDSSIASNFDKVFAVTDDDAIEEAEIQYEYEKNIINEKETQIDARMDNLKTEQSAVSKMIESIEQVKNDNIERSMNITA